MSGITSFAFDPNTNQTTLEWNNTAGAGGTFTINIKDPITNQHYSASPITNITGVNGFGNSEVYIINDILPGTYNFSVDVVDSNNNVTPGSTTQHIISEWRTANLPVITNAVVSPGKITLSWTQDVDATHPTPTKYKIEGYLSGSGAAALTIDNINGTLLTYDVNITTVGSYTFNISTKNFYDILNQGSQNYGPVQIDAKPYAPTDVSGSTTALPNSVVLKWVQPSGNGTSVTDPASYSVYVLDSSSMPVAGSPFSISAPLSVTTLGPFSAGAHTITLRAVDSNGGFSEASALSVNVIPTATAPQYQMISSATNSPGAVTVSWIQAFGDPSLPTADAVTFKIDYTVNGVSGTAIENLDSSSPGITYTQNNAQSQDEYSYTLSGLTEGATFTFKVTSYSARGNSTESSTSAPLTIQSTAGGPGGGGGGGGKGGGGNSGATGYNTMATLEFSYTGYSAGIVQNTDITVLGEEGGALPASEIITVNVPLAKFKKVVEYQGSWTGYAGTGGSQYVQSHPSVLFQPCATGAALTELEAMFNKLKVNGTGAMDSAQRKWVDDDGTTQHDTFGNHILKYVTFTASALDDDELPAESIRKIEEGGVTGPAIATTLTTLDSKVVADSVRDLLRGLFEQAVSANKVKTTDDADGDYRCPSFAIGDTISFLVRYDFTKTRTYLLDSVIDGAGNSAGVRTSILVNGVTFNIDNGTETSIPNSKLYQIKLVATA